MSRKGQNPTLIFHTGAERKPLDVVFPFGYWEKMFAQATKNNADLCYAWTDGLGVNLNILPLSSLDDKHPNWREVEELFDVDGNLQEVVRVPITVANAWTLPDSKMSEWELQGSCFEWFREAYPNGIAWATTNEACFTKWRYYVLQGALKGACDGTFILNGRVVFVEFKTLTGTLSHEQITVGNAIKSNGAEHYVIRSISSFKKLFEVF